MKKQYIEPITEVVNVRLLSSVLQEGDPGIHKWSDGADELGAKKLDFEEFDTEEDIWSGHQTKDAWER
jgi:hypothetical protein